MKAIVFTRYGPPGVLELREVAKPTPADDEVLVRIHATTVTAGDAEIRRFDIKAWLWLVMRLWMGIFKPRGTRILGTELAGEIEATGANVESLHVGDQVFGSAGIALGTNAEYRCVPERGAVAVKPANLSYEEAAAIPFGGRDALHFLRKGKLESGQTILINGAGGSIGTYAVQLAKHFGAKVTAIDSAEKLDMLRSIGADRVIDFACEDFTHSGETYDVVFDVVGKASFSGCLRAVRDGGVLALANPGLTHMLRGLWVSKTGRKTVVTQPADGTVEDLTLLGELAAAGTIKPVMDKGFALERIADAHRYVETGAKQGNVAITVMHEA